MNNSNDNAYNSTGQGQQDPDRIDLNNYMPDPNKRHELKRRLYDSGISNIPMPSVKRPIEENIASKPYSAKMNPSKIQNQSEKKKDIEKFNKNIINNLKHSYELAALQEAKYKGEGTAEYYKSQHIMVPPPQIMGGPKKGGKTLQPKVNQTEQGVAISGLSSTNRILLNKVSKPNQLPSLSDYGRERMNHMGQSQMENMRLLQGPPSVVMAGFEGGYSLGQKNLELARSKYLIDKLTGKLSEELRGKQGKLPPIEEFRESLKSRGSMMDDKQDEEDKADDEDGKEKTHGNGQQKWSDLDKFIELLLDSKSEEETVFVYGLPNPNGDPYDLICCGYSDTREGQHPREKYYTLSGKGLTLYENDMPVEFISLGQWLIERDSYNHIKELNFFKKFKKWKFMRMWKKTIKHINRLRAQNSLEEKLFILQEHFSEHLLQHRAFMLEMEKKRFIDPCNTGDTKELEEFTECQSKKVKDIHEEIRKVSMKARENIDGCFIKVKAELRERIVQEIALTAEKKKNNPIQSSGSMPMKRKASNNVFEKLGFPEGMTYGHRSSLRKECSRFLRFAYLVDFLSLEALSNIYIGSVRDMIYRVKELDESCDMDKVMNADYDDSNQAAGGIRGQEPLFFVSVELSDEIEIPQSEIKLVQIDYYDQKKSKIDEFDLQAHLMLEPEKAEGDEDSEPAEDEGGEVIEPIYKQTVPSIEKYWLRMEPNKDEYCESLKKTFQMGLEHIKNFERWSKHGDLKPYADALEDWDEKVGDQSWEDQADSIFLDPKTWINEDPLYNKQDQIVSDILDSAFFKLKNFLERFQPILEIYWRNKQVDLQEKLMHPMLMNPIDSLQNTIELFKHYHTLFSSKIPKQADIGLIQLNSKNARDNIQPTPERFIKEITAFVPAGMKQMTEESQVWLKQQIQKLSVTASDVAEFVEQSKNYNYANENFQNKRDLIMHIDQVYTTLDLYQLKVKKEDLQKFQETQKNVKELNNLIETVESTMETNKETFKKSLDKLIPEHDIKINELFERAQNPKFLENKDMDEMIRELEEIEQEFKALNDTADKYNSWQTTLETQPSVFENLESLREEMTLRCLMWRSLRDWNGMTEKWKITPFKDIDSKDISKQGDIYFKNVMRIEKSLDANPVQEKLKIQVVQFKEAMPIVTALRNDKLTTEHWAEIKALINQDFDVNDEDFTLQSLIALNVNQYQEDIVAISTQATQEDNLNNQIIKIKSIWQNTASNFETDIDPKTDCIIIKSLEDIYGFIDETLSEINMILGSRFVKPLRVEAEYWKRAIVYIDELVTQWLTLQNNWRYLSKIFEAKDISNSLPEEVKSFNLVDKQYKTLMTQTVKQYPSPLRIFRGKEGTLNQLKTNNEILDRIQKSLEDYMTIKRKAFPRFFFLSSDELIDILAQSGNVEVIQGHMKTLFDNIVKLEITEDSEILGMYSNEKEYVKFNKQKSNKRPVELWLNDVQIEMRSTLKLLLQQANKNYATMDRKDFVLATKGQIVATVAQIQWCFGTENVLNEYAINPVGMHDWLEINEQQIKQLVDMVRGKLGDVERKIIVALVTTDVHARDIIEELDKQKVSTTTDFNWVKQLKYYWEATEDENGVQTEENCIIKQVSAKLTYGYEYMGASSRLVITPLTDKCWITISNALHIKLGANPAGPAGTGKTESTKDLAKAIAIQCIVFNCSDQVDYQMMQRLFSGLCQQGCWTCLDEFNRIDIEVLSVIAQQLQQVRKALIALPNNSEINVFTFEGTEMPIKKEFGCHVTMNPGYAGRTELPDNLKVLFRPVAMMIPNYAMIAEIMLAAEGFVESKNLSKKMTQLYKLSSEQLSQQDHYDFGLRAVKSVLVMAGSLKRENADLPEGGVLIRAMRDANVPKFLREDLPLFNAIIQDLFPDEKITENNYGSLQTVIEEVVESKSLQKHAPFVTKVIQLFETFNVRFGVMLVGPTGSGKTQCYEVLQDVFITMKARGADAENPVFQNVTKVVLNPKSISMGEMYGEVDVVSQEWTDGLASKIMRNASKETDDDKTWVVFDGPVDALWIENMNTVLDDNMTLCLANGQRIKLRSEMRMLFEVQDLRVASPATVSRCGMVYLTPDQLGWRPYVKTWISTFFVDEKKELLSEMLKEHLWVNFEATIDLALDWIRENGKEPIKTTDLQLVASLINILENFLDESKGFKAKLEEDKKKMLDACFAFSYAWGLGGALTQVTKDKFDTIVRDQFKAASIPPSNSVFDYWYDLKKDKCFKPWALKVIAFEYDKDASFFDLMVPTQDTTKYSYLLEILQNMQKPMMFTGNSGVGKSVVIQRQLQNMVKDEGGVVPVIINMSAQTSSQRTQQTIEEKVEKKGKGKFGPPPPAGSLAIFVDDINMPEVEEYGAQPPIELLRLFIDRGGLFNRKDWEWFDVLDANVIACAAPPGGGRAEITQRLTRRFNMFCLPEASAGTLTTIFASILKGFLSTGFSEKIKNLGENSISSTIEIYQRIQEDLRATPSKFHYQFNLRDVSKVVQGLCMVKPVSIPTEETFQKLWVNESFRVFFDRLTDDNDREWFKDLIIDLLSKNFKQSAEKQDYFVDNKIMYGDLLKLDSPVQLYENIIDKQKLLKVLHGGLDEYNITFTSKMNLVLFDDALEHILRIARVLKQPRGHIMLIGVGGSGKQSLIRLCTFLRQMEYKTIEIAKKYGTSNFRDDVKAFMKVAGIKGSGISFVMTDTQIIDEAFIENLNNLLNTGTIPNLMLEEDNTEIENDLRPVLQQRKLADGKDAILQFFTDRVREFLHICLCMSPVGDTLRIRCRNFPSLINCCTLDWFGRWPEEALMFVSSEFLKELPDTSDELKKNIAVMCCRIHLSVEEQSENFYSQLRRRVYTTPKSYLDLINLYIAVLDKKRFEYTQNKMRLSNGVNKLNETKKQIAELKIKLTEMQPILAKKNIELAEALIVVNKDKAVADEKERVVSAEAEIVNKKAEEAKAIADDASADLALAEPQLQAAQKAVQNLDRNDINEIKNFPKPPEGVKFVMEAIMILLEQKTDWQSIKSYISDVNSFLGELKNYKTEKVKEKTWEKFRKNYLSKPEFEVSFVMKVNQAAASLCVWAIACEKYAVVVKKVAPKKAKLAEVTIILNEAKAELKIKLDEVQAVKDKVAKLEADCNKMNDEKENLENEISTSENRMGRAEQLVVLLADEGERWNISVGVITEEIVKLVGDVFLSCACISYFGAFTGQFREVMTKDWHEQCSERDIPSSEVFNLVTIMGDPVVLRNWGIAGLPSDQVSSENGILTTKAERFALCIDPQQQANMWIKKLEKQNGLRICKFGQETFVKEIATAVDNGKAVLIEDCEELIDPVIDPILQKQQVKTDAGLVQIKIGDKTYNFDDNFTLYMTTKLPNPHYIPEICIKVTLINFTVTFSGLQQQLLGDVVIAERPEVEKQRDMIVLQMASDSKSLKDQENLILKNLLGATIFEILDSDELINLLKVSKETTDAINIRMEEAKEVEITIDSTRNDYKEVAIRGSIIYFVIADLSGIDPMYQNSLIYIKTLFSRAIDQSPESDDLAIRLPSLIDNITRLIFTNISRGLFEKDKIIFSFLITTSIMKQLDKIDQGVWNIFLRGPTVMTPEEKASMLDSPDLAVIPSLYWENLVSAELRSKGQFDGITKHVIDNWKEWREWTRSEFPYTEKMPGDYSEKLSNFDKFIMVKCLRVEMIQRSISQFIILELDQFFVESVSSAMEIVYPEISITTPFIFVLTAGSDPMSILLKFAEEKNMADRLHQISLGQGQGPKATELIKQAKINGDWIMLQNCHLGRSFMPDLEKIVLLFEETKDQIHPDFRLYLTSTPASYFPVSVLQNSVKVTTEPPRGLKANMKRSYNQINQEMLDKCPSKPEMWRKLLFNLSFFHANLQERKKFGSLGWNIQYDFNDSDLDTTFTMLQLFLADQEEIPWDALIYIFGHVNYGGRVTDDNDRICLIKTLQKYCSPESLRDDYKYSPLPTYFCPPDGTIDKYRDYIETFPLNDNPEIFGLFENANITYMQNESLRQIETILSIQPRIVGGGVGMSPDELVLSKAAELLSSLPELLLQSEGAKELFTINAQGLIPSFSTVLVQELTKFNNMLGIMSTSLKNLDLAIKGFIVMSSTLDSMYIKIQNNQVPSNWAAYPSLKPLSSWFTDLIKRIDFFRMWLHHGNPPAYWVSGFFFPQGFMTGVLQTHARHYQIAIDKLTFSFSYMDAEGVEDIEEKPEDGVYIYGLFMDGARWDRENQIIADQIPTVMYDRLPVIHFKPQDGYVRDPDEYQAPLYKTSERKGILSTTGLSTNFIDHVSTPSKENPAHWVQRGAALLAMLDD